MCLLALDVDVKFFPHTWHKKDFSPVLTYNGFPLLRYSLKAETDMEWKTLKSCVSINPSHTHLVMFSSVSLIFKVLSTLLTRNLVLIEMSAFYVPSTVTTITKYLPTSLTPELFHRRVDFTINEFLQIDSRICENENKSILFIGLSQFKIHFRVSSATMFNDWSFIFVESATF